jgi:Na+-transporting NADH:ubiquinone oxidoreductase subunit NqrC
VAPRKKPYQPRRGAQSPNTVLVIFLIFFVLGTIVAGVLAYYGYDGQKKLKEEAKNKEAAAKSALKAEDWANFQSYLARKAFGDPFHKEEGIDEETQWQAALDDFQVDDKAKTVSLKADSKFKDMKNKAEVEQMFKKAIENLGWDAAGKKFQSNYADRIAKVQAALTKAEADYGTTLAQKEALKDDIEKLAVKRKEFYEQALAEIKKGNNQALTEALAKTKEMTKLLEDNNDLNGKLAQAKEKAAGDLRDKEKQIHDLKVTLATLRKEVAANVEGGGGGAAAGGGAKEVGQPHALFLDISQGKPLWDRPRAKIIRVDAQGTRVTIDKGSAQGIRPGQTFLVFGAGPGGKATGRLRGTVEVQDVLDDNTSVAWVTSYYDASGMEIAVGNGRLGTILRQGENPVAEGDLLFNLAWGAHVAISGGVSWGNPLASSPAEQMRQLRQFINLLQKQGVTVDAYIDLTDGQIKGAMTGHTNYLIHGALPSVQKEGAGARAKVDSAINASDRKLFEEAVGNGDFIISVDNFLDVIGYRAPQNPGERAMSNFRRGLPTAGSGYITEALGGAKNQK